MNFKDRYKQVYEDIKPDAVFSEQLARKLEQEQKTMSSRRKVWISTGVAAAAAVVCMIAINIGEPEKQPDMQGIQNKAETVDTPSAGHGFGDRTWYGDARTSDEMLEAFQTLLQEEEIKTLYCSDAEVFEEQDILAREEIASLVNTLSGAKNADEQVSGECKYYMLVFANGDIVKFEIYDDRYLKLKDSDGIYNL